jgi:ribosomal protein L31E
MPTRLLTINIRNYLVSQPRRKRPMKISSWVKFRIAQSTNVRTEDVKISKELNSIIMKEHLNSMKKLKVNINIEKNVATVTPFAEKKAATTLDAKAKHEAATGAKKPAAVAPVKAVPAQAVKPPVAQPKQPTQVAQTPAKKEDAKKTDPKNTTG